MHRYVISEIHSSVHIGEYAGRTWVVEAPDRLTALETLDRERPDHVQLRVVDSTEDGNPT